MHSQCGLYKIGELRRLDESIILYRSPELYRPQSQRRERESVAISHGPRNTDHGRGKRQLG
jgi:hypothetical protein